MTVAAVCCCRKIKKGRSQDRNRPLTCLELLGRYSNRRNWVKTVHRALDSRRTVTESPTLRGTVRRLVPDEVTALVHGYRAGATVYELAERFGINRKTVALHLHRKGVNMRRQGLADAQVSAAAVKYRDGESLDTIGEHLGVDSTTVWRALVKAGVPMRDTHGRAR